ncbi:hypothetical protein BD413DRAFT_520147 [Trametes elegans]|nr:hypothetical protein BD413DRAFT_520147 [Trametes elegans]
MVAFAYAISPHAYALVRRHPTSTQGRQSRLLDIPKHTHAHSSAFVPRTPEAHPSSLPPAASFLLVILDCARNTL